MLKVLKLAEKYFVPPFGGQAKHKARKSYLVFRILNNFWNSFFLITINVSRTNLKTNLRDVIACRINCQNLVSGSTQNLLSLIKQNFILSQLFFD